MTHKIPSWSANVTLNMPRDERALLGRLSVRHAAHSVGGFIKFLYAVGLAAKDRLGAAELLRIRHRYYPPLHTCHDHAVRESKNEFVESI